MTWACGPDFSPKVRRQAIWKFGAASTFSTDCSRLPPASGQSACGAGAGRKKSWPFSASETLSWSLSSSSEMRSPLAAFDTFGRLANGFCKVEQPVTTRLVATIAAMTLAWRRGVIGRLRQAVIEPSPDLGTPGGGPTIETAAAALWRRLSRPQRRVEASPESISAIASWARWRMSSGALRLSCSVLKSLRASAPRPAISLAMASVSRANTA